MDARLKDEELENPFLALDSVFANYSLIEIRIELKAIEKKYFQKSFLLTSKSSRPYDDMLFFFEQLDKLIQAAYLLHDYHFGPHKNNPT